MSQELVPTTYHRYAYNAINGVETMPHGDHLTEPQVEELNSNFDVNVVPIRHGYGLDTDPDALRNGNAPSIADYEHVKSVVDTMDTDDTLLVETVGFDSEHDVRQNNFGQDMINVLDRVYKTKTADSLDYEKLRIAEQRLKADRDGYEIDALDYAVGYALLRGIDVVYADMDSFEGNRLDDMMGEDARDAMGMPLDTSHLGVANSMREKRAANTVKDTALERLKTQGSTVDGSKSRLVLLYGADHIDGLKQQFDNLGININVFPEAIDDPIGRQSEHGEQLKRVAA